MVDITNKYFPVLDKGFVALKDIMGGDEDIVEAARVSYGKGTKVGSDDKTLIRYLMRHKHSTPLEMVVFKFHISMPIHAHRQFIRHRMSCLSGDTLLWFDEPAAIKKGERKRNSLSLEDIFKKWHFGAKPIPCRWDRSKQSIVPLKERIKTKNLRCYDESTGDIIHTHITDVWQSGIKPVFRITLANGYQIKMTKDHLCYTMDGWKRLEDAIDLKFNDGKITYRNSNKFVCNGELAYKNKEWLIERRKEGLSVSQIAELANCSYMTIRKYLKRYNLKYTNSEKGVLAGKGQIGTKRPNAKYTYPSEKGLENIRKARSGPASNWWKGGISSERAKIGMWVSARAKKIYEKFNYSCVTCNFNQKLNVHHIDPVWHNLEKAYDLENLTCLCEKCHKLLHAKNLELLFMEYYSSQQDLTTFFEKNNLTIVRHEKKKRPKIAKLIGRFEKVVNVEFIGEEMTYDISVEGPNHNFVANGFIVHNSTNEYSARYSVVPEVCYTPLKEQVGFQSKNNKQGRSEDSIEEEEYENYLNKIGEIRELGFSHYNNLLNNGIAREVARMDLPLSTYTYFYWKIDLHNLCHFLKLRTDPHAQWEIRQFAGILAGIVKHTCPLAFEAWYDYSFAASNWTLLDKKFNNHLLNNIERYECDFGNVQRMKETYKLIEPTTHKDFGMSDRELDEFWAKLHVPDYKDFSLRLEEAKTAEYFENLVK